MSGFAPDPSQLPIVYPPVDIPAPEVPPPDFKTIASSFGAAHVEAEKALQGEPGYFDWLWKQLLRAVGAVISVFADLATLVLAQIIETLHHSDPEINQLVTVVMAGMFDQSVPVNAFADAYAAENRRGTSAAVLNVFMNALQAGQTAGAALVPSDAGAKAFLQACTHMAVEGWFLGWVAELTAAGQLETFAELKDIIESSLGLGRVARRVLAPPVKILVEDPYTWLLNQKYHPTLLNPGEAVRGYLRGVFDRTQLQAIMDLHGYSSDKVTNLIDDQVKMINPAEMDVIRRFDQWSDTDAVNALKRMGYDDASGGEWLHSADVTRGWEWDRQLLAEALALLKARHITQAQYETQIGQTSLTQDEKDHYSKLGSMQAVTSRTRFTMAEGQELYRKGIWDVLDFEDLAAYHGYSFDDIQALDALVRLDIQKDIDAAAAKAAAAARRQAADAKRAAEEAAKLLKAQLQVEEKGVSEAQYEYLVEQGLKSYADYRLYLIAKEVAPDNANALVTALQKKLSDKAAAAAAKAAALAARQIKHISIAQLETGLKQGLIQQPEFIAALVARGMPLTDAALVAAEVQGQIDTAATKAKATAAAKAAAAEKHVDLSQEQRAVRLGIETIDQYSAFLDAHGFQPHDRDVLVAELQAQLATDQQTAAKKAAAAAKLAQKGISLSQLERLVRAGVKTVADYTAALQSAGYDAADQQAMTEMLQLQMQQDQQDLIVHGHAAALVDQLGVSLADLERAVKLSVVPIATYQDALQRAGVSAADQQTLVANLAAQIKTTRAAQTTMQSVSKTVAAAGVTLASLEKDTVSGKISLTQFQALLAGYGVAAADVTDVVQLVQDEIDNAAAVKALVSQATAKAAAKGLDLAQITAAYKAQVLDEATWRADVAGLGYDAADVEILFETLAAAQAATAAKQAAKATGTATTAAPGAAAAATAG